jgi:nucleoid-associated protein YgaU
MSYPYDPTSPSSSKGWGGQGVYPEASPAPDRDIAQHDIETIAKYFMVYREENKRLQDEVQTLRTMISRLRESVESNPLPGKGEG